MLPSGITLDDYLSFLWGLISGARVRSEFLAAREVEQACSAFVDFSSRLRILDLGSGRLRPQTLIRARQGHECFGVDLANNSKELVSEGLYKIARSLFRFHLTLLTKKRQGAFDPMFIQGTVEALPIASGSVDLVISVAAFEHFLNIDAVLAEIQRVLSPQGVVSVYVHHFSCLSGGHTVGRCHNAIDRLPRGTVPWEHLRRRQESFPVPLNRWRPNQYISAFSKYFRIERSELVGSEGVEMLTPEILEELSDYSREELIRPGLVIVARKL